MQTRYHTDHDLDLQDTAEQDREISLGTTTILGIFFALALICAVFFGFGYSMGRRSAQSAVSATEPEVRTDAGTPKPSPGSPVGQAGRQSSTAQSTIVPIDSSDNTTPESQSPAPVETALKVSAPEPRPVNIQSHPETSTKPPTAIPVSTAAPQPGSPIVQVAAMSHQEDADVVAIDLKRRGYTVTIRREPQDKFFHVQIGPFSNKKEADAMRQRLQTDGYNNAIVK